MTLEYVGTRGKEKQVPNLVTFSQTILYPKAGLGGLFAPNEIPLIGERDIYSMATYSYEQLATVILKLFGVDIPDDVIQKSLLCYEKFDNPKNPVPVLKLDTNTFVSELWHGPTRAFKDIALQPFPYLLSHLAQKFNKKYVIAVATSGDTGPAALEGFSCLANTKIVCYYPLEGTSRVQAEQMQKAQGLNCKAFAVDTDFDGLQKLLKDMLNSQAFNDDLSANGYDLSVANSVNFGRIVFQVVYHFWTYLQMYKNGELRTGEKVDFIIPSGNFGNALGAFYAKMMGLPIGKIVLASNENNVLSDFVNRGMYDLRDRKLEKTISPAMDILISSNVERLLFHLFGSEKTFELMKNLEEKRFFQLDFSQMKVIQHIFSADFATELQIKTAISQLYTDYEYLIDPHTATAFVVRQKLGLSDKHVILSTAEWTKFPETIAEIFVCGSDFSSICSKLGVELPIQIKKLQDLPVCHSEIIEDLEMRCKLIDFLNE